jgi:hypothetical protein
MEITVVIMAATAIITNLKRFFRLSRYLCG